MKSQIENPSCLINQAKDEISSEKVEKTWDNCLLYLDSSEDFKLFIKSFGAEKLVQQIKNKVVDSFSDIENMVFIGIVRYLGDDLSFQEGDLEYNSDNFEIYLEHFSVLNGIFKTVGIYNAFLKQAKAEMSKAFDNGDFDLFFNIMQIPEIKLDERMIKGLGLNIIDNYSEVNEETREKNFKSYCDYRKRIFDFDGNYPNQDQGNLVIYVRTKSCPHDMILEEVKSIISALKIYLKQKSLIFNKLSYVSSYSSERLSLNIEELFDIKYFDVHGEQFDKINKENEIMNCSHGSFSKVVQEEKPVFTIFGIETIKDPFNRSNISISQDYINKYIIPFDVQFHKKEVKNLERYKKVIQETIRVVRELEERYIELCKKEI